MADSETVPLELEGDRQISQRLMRRAALLSLSMAAILLLLKAYAWWQVGSVSILSSLIDSALDVGASSVNLLAIRHALQPADREHRFGHGKAEPIAGLVQVTLILGSSLYLLYEVIHHFLHPQGLAHIQAGFVVLLLSVAATALVVGYQRYVIRRTGSVAIRADAAHYAGDFAVNLGAIFALIAVDALHLWWADPAIGLLTAGFIAYTALGIGRVALDMLMDREMSDDARRRIKEIVLAHKEVQAIHDLRTREAGQDCFIQFHLELDGSISLHEAHRISDEVEQDLRQAFPGAEFLIHQDPAGQERSTRRFA